MRGSVQSKTTALAAKDKKLQEVSRRAASTHAGTDAMSARTQQQQRAPLPGTRQSVRGQSAMIATLEEALADARKQVAHLKGRDLVLTENVKRLQRERQQVALDAAEEARAALVKERETGAALQRKVAGLQKAVDKVQPLDSMCLTSHQGM